MSRHLKGSVTLPGSKSESNRALMIAAYGGFVLEAENLSTAHDTVLLKSLLARIANAHPDELTEVDCEDDGTAVRFLTTYLAGLPGRWQVTGTERMQQRPMRPLLDALRQLGADISCLGSEGFLPLEIHGKPLEGGVISLDASRSSQFVSSLLMAAPMWDNGLDLNVMGAKTSMPYVEMTVRMMRHFGAEVGWHGERLKVLPHPYRPSLFTVANDWSAASYWYEMAALSEGCDLLLEGLGPDPMQGDAVVADWFLSFGVHTTFEDKGVRIVKEDSSLQGNCYKSVEFDFAQHPDLFPTMMATCVALHVPAVFRGVENLSYKESNRVYTIITELSRYYTFINIVFNHEIVIGKSSIKESAIYNIGVNFKTYNDHRIAMALAPLFLKVGKVCFDDPDVVNKSYPAFWEMLKKTS